MNQIKFGTSGWRGVLAGTSAVGDGDGGGDDELCVVRADHDGADRRPLARRPLASVDRDVGAGDGRRQRGIARLRARISGPDVNVSMVITIYKQSAFHDSV